MAASALLAAASVASLNLCTDEYLLLLARPQEIASVSFLSQDPQESPLWKLARRHPSNRGSLEDILAQPLGSRILDDRMIKPLCAAREFAMPIGALNEHGRRTDE